jgi:hypothetical protein
MTELFALFGTVPSELAHGEPFCLRYFAYNFMYFSGDQMSNCSAYEQAMFQIRCVSSRWLVRHDSSLTLFACLSEASPLYDPHLEIPRCIPALQFCAVIVSLLAVLLFGTNLCKVPSHSSLQLFEEPLHQIALAVDSDDGLVTSNVLRSHIKSSANATVTLHYLAHRVRLSHKAKKTILSGCVTS